ncbi:MAG: hypothetical protein HY922_08765 [Elusimicrobia bacterium]|nr:hypothetical protein [Elusimicrobiota bacterium]
MQITKDDLAKLVVLQEQDKVIDILEAAIAEAPGQIEALRAEADAEKTALAQAKDRLLKLQLERKEKELDLAKMEEEIRKHNIELNAVKTNEAFRALQTEIDRCKAEAGELETRTLEIMERCDSLLKEEKAKTAKLKAAEAVIQEKISGLEARKSEDEAKLAVEKTKREALIVGLPGLVLTHYDNVRRRRGGVAVARLNGNTCTVCRMNQPPQVVVNLAKGNVVVCCESCQRILYSAELAGAKPA